MVRADERFKSVRDQITTWHCFSFGEHYDPDKVSFGSLVALNDELLAPGAGYAPHQHRDVDIVTWVLEGTLLHEDSIGTRSRIRNGTVQRLTAGSGVTHSESNGGGPGERLRFVQLWFALTASDVGPSYETWMPEDENNLFGFTPVAASTTPSLTASLSPSTAPRGGATLCVPGVSVSVGHLPVGSTGQIAGVRRGVSASFTYVATGRLRTRGPGDVHAGLLEAGDAVRSTGPGLEFTALERTEVVWIELSGADLGR